MNTADDVAARGSPRSIHEIVILVLDDNGERLSIAVFSQGTQVGDVKTLGISTIRQEQWEFKTIFLFEEYINQPLRFERANEAKEVLAEFAQDTIRSLQLGGIIEGAGLSADTKVFIEIKGIVERAYGLPWEALENSKFWTGAIAAGRTVPAIIVRRSVSTVPNEEDRHGELGGTITPHPAEEINILLVVARKNGPDNGEPDINYRLNALPLTQLVNKLGPKARLRIARPGTYQSFQDALARRRYDVVHLDMHGMSLPGVDAKLGFTAPTAEQSEHDEGLEWVPASDVVNDLVRNGALLVVINACQSASGGASVSNLAAVLVRRGVNGVVGMTHSILQDAVQIFVPTFYTSFLIDGQSAVESTYRARRALQFNRTRKTTTFDMEVDLHDYILPVVFHAGGGAFSPARSPRSGVQTVGSLPNIDTASQQDAPSPCDEPFLGRDADMFRVERRLFLEGPIGLIYGWPCAGKATLINYLADWWRQSGCIGEIRRLDCSAGHEEVQASTSENAHAAANPDQRQQRGEGAIDCTNLPKSEPPSSVLPSLIIVAHLEALPQDSHPQLVQYLVNVTRERRAFVIMSSDDLKFYKYAVAAGCTVWRYDLRGLDHQDTLKFVSSCLKPTTMAATSASEINSPSSADLRYLRRILRLFGHNSVAVVALESVLRQTGMSPARVFWQLQSHPLGMAWSSGSPRQLVEAMSSKLPRTAPESSSGWLPWPTLSGGLFFYDQIRKTTSPNRLKITPLTRNYLTGPQMTHHSRKKGMDILHPLLAEWIRQAYPHREINRESWMRETVTHYFNLCRGVSTGRNRRLGRTLSTLQSEFWNLVACMEFCLNMQASTGEPDAGIILDLLWATCLRVQCVTTTRPTREALEDREVLADLSTAVVMVRLPRFRPFDSDAWDAYNEACLCEYRRTSTLSSLDVARIVLHCLFLAKYSVSSTATARPWILASTALLEDVDLLGSEGGLQTLLRFLKCAAIVLDAELGFKKMTPLKRLIDLSHKMPLIQLPSSVKDFITTWTNDYIWRLGGSVVSPTSTGVENRLRRVCMATSGVRHFTWNSRIYMESVEM